MTRTTGRLLVIRGVPIVALVVFALLLFSGSLTQPDHNLLRPLLNGLWAIGAASLVLTLRQSFRAPWRNDPWERTWQEDWGMVAVGVALALGATPWDHNVPLSFAAAGLFALGGSGVYPFLK